METQAAPAPRIEPLLLEVADVVNTTLDLDTTLQRVAELVRKVIDYEIFAILLLNEKTQELRIRFSIGHPPELAEKMRIKVGEGVTGLAAQRGEAVLVNNVAEESRYISSLPRVKSELAVPLIIKNRVIGVIDIEAPQRDYFTEAHKRLLVLIASRMAIGIENARLFTRANRQARTLMLLNEISRELTLILNLDQLLKRIGELLSRLIDYQMFSVMLLDPTGTKLQHRFSLRFNMNVQIKHDIPIDQGLVGYAVRHKEAVLVPDVCTDPRYIALNPETHSELCVPLIYKDNAIGVLDIEHTRRGYFTEDHRRTITTLAAQVAIAIENARLYEQVARQERRLERDLALARELQRRLLPENPPVLPNMELAARFVPARAIGGDLYDFVKYTQDRSAIVVGDVSGKGAPAAIYAALVSGILRSHVAVEPSHSEMLAAVNLSLRERPIEAQFVSLIYAVWDDAEQKLWLSNSGLPRPIYCHRGQVELIPATGLPLGLFEDAQYDEFTYQAKPGDLFVFFSDGILDARSRAGDLFGRERLERVVASLSDKPAPVVVDAIFDAVNDHASGMEAFDDQTVVVARIAGESAERPQAPNLPTKQTEQA
jgi:sigma-B regulation protein RsbU (phosphoserine phosphatase)